MKVYRKLDHLVRGYMFPAIFRVRKTGIGEVERSVDLFLCHWWAGRVYHQGLVGYFLEDSGRRESVRLLFNDTEVSRLFSLIAQAFLVRKERNLFIERVFGNLIFRS